MNKHWMRFVGVAFLIAVVAGCASSLCAQTETTGALVGTVTDSSGSVIPGATITLVNKGTAQSFTTTSSSSGTYRFSLLSPGAYDVTFSAQAFKSSHVGSVTVSVTETPTVDAKLEIGETSQTVTVTGEAPQVQTETAAIGTLLDSKAITDVPLTTRNYTQVISLSAGAITAVYNASALGRGSQDANVNGNSTASNNYQVDGGDSNNWANNTVGTGAASTNGTGGMPIPNPDAIAEFKIQTSQYDAGYGRNAGANVNMVLKSGTNDFHGSAFEFNRNNIFNANSFFLNKAGQPRPDMKQNQFGGTIGGPIKKNKLFFFGSYQGTRQINGLDTTSTATEFQPALTNDRTAATIGSQFCPANHLPPPGGTNKYYTSAGGATGAGVQVACDGSNINPVALALLQLKAPGGGYLFPTPQTIVTDSTSANFGNGSSSYSIPSRYREDQMVLTGDYLISSKHTLALRYFFDRVPITQSFVPDSATVPGTPGTPATFTSRDHLATVKVTSVMTNFVVNEFKVSYTRNTIDSVALGLPTAASIGMTSPADIFYPVPPGIVFSGSLGSYDVLGGTGEEFHGVTEQTLLGDQISWIHGKQSFRFGGNVEKVYWHGDIPGRSRGLLTFNNFTDFLIGQGAATNGSPTGLSNINNIASTGGGGAQQGVDALGGITIRQGAIPASLFAQDDIRVTSRLTVNLGLRWEYVPANYNTSGQTGSFNYALAATVPVPPLSGTFAGDTVSSFYNGNTINPYTGLLFGPPPTGVIQRTTKSLFSNNNPLDNFAPRLGVAWQALGKLVVRTGYGWFYQTNGGNGLDSAGLTQQPFAQRFFGTGTSVAYATLKDPYHAATLGYLPRTPTSGLSDAIGGPIYKIPMLQQWSLGTQYQLTPSTALEVDYVGSYGSHLAQTFGMNQSLLASGANPVNCGYDGNIAHCITINTSGNAVQRAPILGEVPSALSDAAFGGSSWYHGLQTSVRKRMSHGLTVSGNYTYSRVMSDTTINNDQTNRTTDWARLTYDRTHRIVVNYTYELPGPKEEGITKKLLGGWSMSGIAVVQTGTPLTLTDSRGGTIYGQAGISTAFLCPGASVGSIRTAGGNDQARLNNWFNTTVVAGATGSTCGAFPVFPVALGGDGRATGYGNLGQSVVNGPGQFNWDMSLTKVMTVGGIREGAQLVFRTEFYNAFNHPQFGNPGVAANSASSFGSITTTTVSPRLIQFGLKYIF